MDCYFVLGCRCSSHTADEVCDEPRWVRRRVASPCDRPHHLVVDLFGVLAIILLLPEAHSFPALRKVPDEGRLRAGPNISPSTGLPRRSCVYLLMVPIFLCWEGSGRVSQNVERRQPRTAPPCARTLPSQSSRQRLKTSQVGNCWVNWTTMLDDETFDMGLRAIRDLRRCRSGADADDPVMQTAIERCAKTIALSEQIRARARCAATPQPRSMMHCGCHARPKR